MFKTIFALSLTLSAGAVSAGSDEEKATAAASNAEAIVVQFIDARDDKQLAGADAVIEKAWQNYIRYHVMNSDIGKQLAMIRARSASSSRDKQRVADAWDVAIRLQPLNLPKERRLALALQAANATANAGDFRASSRYFAVAHTYAFAHDRNAKVLQLNIKINELRALGPKMQWRRLRDNITDMRLFSEGFSLWTLPRLEALVSEGELRVALQPENDKKRKDLSELKSKIELMMKNMSNILTPPYVNRVRNFYYIIEDYYGL